MFDYRYHALSLAAVLFALAVGVLIGVAIGDSSLLSSARDGIVANLRSEVSASERHSEQLSGRLTEEETLAGALYPISVHGLLRERNIGLVFLGASSDEIDELVRQAVTQAGGNVKTVVAVREPLNLTAIAGQASGTEYTALASNPLDPSLLRRFGVRMGQQLVRGGRLLGRVQASLLSSYDGEVGRLDGIVVLRTEPAKTAGSGETVEAAQASAMKTSSEFEAGLVHGAEAQGVPVVGVELSSTTPSQVPWYESEDMASIDDLDALAGRAALAFALAGDHGAYGVKPTADSLLPRVVSQTAQP
jgi:Copper transport outer membrane protein, MctB